MTADLSPEQTATAAPVDRSSPYISITGVDKVYAVDGSPITALRDVNLEIAAGEFISVV